MRLETKTIKVIDHARTGAGMKAARARRGITAKAIAYALKINQPYLSDLEAGRRNWSDARAKEYARAVIELSRQKQK
jgi:cytoskeletal protein RodZ